MRLKNIFGPPLGPKLQDDNAAQGLPERSPAGLTFERIYFSRGSRWVFEGLSLALPERRIGLVGDNGAGKSTLLRLANGLLQPDQGEVIVNGRSTKQSGRNLCNDVGFLFQNSDHQIIFPTVGEEIEFALIENGDTAAEARRKTEDLLALHGCDGWINRAIQDLSEGQKQLVCILAVLVTQPTIMLLDEPFSSLDLPTRLSLSERLARLTQHIVMASHELDLLSNFDRVIWLENGQVRADGTPSRVLPQYRAHSTTRGEAMLKGGVV